MVRVRLLSSDSIDFGVDDLQSDYLNDILKDLPDGDVATINVPFTSYTVLGFLKDVDCQYQNVNVLQLRNLLGLRCLEIEEEVGSDEDDCYDPHDDTNYEELEETQYLIKVELESNSSFSDLDQSDMESVENWQEAEEITNLEQSQCIQQSLYETPQDQTAVLVSPVPLPRENEEESGERVQEANREEYADEQTMEPSNNFNETSRETNIEHLFNLDHSEAEVEFSDVSSLHEDDVQDKDVQQCVFNELQDEILSDTPSDAATVGPGLERNRKLQVIFVDAGLESIQDVKKAKGRKRKRGKKYF